MEPIDLILNESQRHEKLNLYSGTISTPKKAVSIFPQTLPNEIEKFFKR